MLTLNRLHIAAILESPNLLSEWVLYTLTPIPSGDLDSPQVVLDMKPVWLSFEVLDNDDLTENKRTANSLSLK